MNEFFARIFSQARAVWDNLSKPQRFWVVGVGSVTLILLLTVIYMAQRPHFVPLGTFEMQQAAQIKGELEKRGYQLDRDYQLANDGKTIEVDAKLRYEMNLALAEKGLFGHAEKGFTIFEEFDITTTDYEQRLRTLEALKSVMRSMIRSYNQVEDVEISVPFIENQSIFIENEIAQTASIVLTLKPGAKLDNEQIKAIRSLIAGGFPALVEEKITLTDQFARPLMAEDEESGQSTKQAKIVKETERSLEEKIVKALGPALGNDKFTVSVNVEFDWDNVHVNQEKFEMPGFEQMRQSEQNENEILKGQGLRPGGEPGVAANAPPVYNAITNAGPVDYSRTENIINYLADKTVTERIQSPYIKRISAAVAVDGVWKEEKDTAGRIARAYQARSGDEMDHIKALVQSALGQSLTRQDLIEVRNLPWDRTREFERLDEMKATTEFQRRLMIYGLLTAPLLILLAFLYAAWRRHIRVREEDMARHRELERQRALAAAEAGLAGEISLEDQERQEIQRRAASLARAKPKIVADLIRTWLSEEAPAA